MQQIRKAVGYSPEEVYEKIESKYGTNYRIISKESRVKYTFPLSFKKEYTFEYEVAKELKRGKQDIIEVLKLSRQERQERMAKPTSDIAMKAKVESVSENQSSPTLSEELRVIQAHLLDQGFEQKWIDHLVERAFLENPKTVDEWKHCINNILISEMEDWKEVNDFQVMTLFGPTGVGKTTTLIKLMNRLQTGSKKIGVITTDNFRVGAFEQMKNYSEKLNFPLIQSDVNELELPVNNMKHQKGMDYILIDTYGRNPKDDQMRSEIEMYLKTVKPESACLVLAANQKYRDMVTTLRAYDVSINHLMITKMDETDTYGFIYNLYKEFGIPVSYLTFGQKVPDDIEVFTASNYTKKIWEGFSN